MVGTVMSIILSIVAYVPLLSFNIFFTSLSHLYNKLPLYVDRIPCAIVDEFADSNSKITC